jgi:hypothetical protein
MDWLVGGQTRRQRRRYQLLHLNILHTETCYFSPFGNKVVYYTEPKLDSCSISQNFCAWRVK